MKRARGIGVAVAGAGLLALAGLALWMVLAQRAVARAAGGGAPPALSYGTLPPNPSYDARLTTYLQQRFLIDDPKRIKLGPLMRTPFAGIIGRMVQLTNEKGQSGTVGVFTDSGYTHIILGELQDLSKEPWGPRSNLGSLHLEDRPTVGPADAPVTIIEFADFECPFCARAFGLLETMVRTTYRNKIRLVFKNNPLSSVHPWAERGAVAAECARLQRPDAFWDFARDFYTNQASVNRDNIDQRSRRIATRLGLDLTLLDACMDGTSAEQRLDEDRADAKAAGVVSTPTFFINGTKIVGLPDDNAFKFVVDSQLREAARHAGR